MIGTYENSPIHTDTVLSGFRKSTRKLQVTSIAKYLGRCQLLLFTREIGGNSTGGLTMKRFVLTAGSKAVIAGIFFLGITGVGLRAQEMSCRNSTLKGDYAFTVSGQVFMPVTAKDGTVSTIVVQRDGIAMTHFDGEGHLSQVDFVLSSPNAPTPPSPPPPPPTDSNTGFHNMEMGTYTVFPDCTGTFTIDTPKTSPAITVKFVLSNGGRSIHTIVTALVLPGATMPVPALIHSEGRRLGRIVEWWE
jgi:hypothetical protein